MVRGQGSFRPHGNAWQQWNVVEGARFEGARYPGLAQASLFHFLSVNCGWGSPHNGDQIPTSLSQFVKIKLKQCYGLRVFWTFKQYTKCKYFNQELLSCFPLKDSLLGVYFSCLLRSVWLVIFPHQVLGWGFLVFWFFGFLVFWFFDFLVFWLFSLCVYFCKWASLAESSSKNYFSWNLHHVTKSYVNVTCPSLFVAKFRDREEDRVCFLKINGQHITVKPID